MRDNCHARRERRTQSAQCDRAQLVVLYLFEALEARVLLASTRFAVIGDYGNNSTGEADVAARVKTWNPEYVVTVGDNSYPIGAAAELDPNIGRYYHEFIKYPAGSTSIYANVPGQPTVNKFYPALGNHDWGNVVPNPSGANPYLNYFELPGNERYYDVVQGPVHLFIVDSDANEPDGITSTGVQATWLRNKLAAATEPWKFVFFHHPSYSSNGSTTALRWPFAAWGASAVVQGHVHNYERLAEEGIPYFVDGLGGASLQGVSGTPIAGSQFRYGSDYGAMLVNADDTAATFQFITRTGAIIDTYTLSKTPVTTTTFIPTGSAWRYLDTGTTPAVAWRGGTSFDDSTWKNNNAQLGYGDGDETTVVGFGPDANNKYITTYFRKTFNVADRNAITALNLRLLRDDGAVVYLNGTEVFRTNMPTGTITGTTLASTAIGGADETTFILGSLSTAGLLNGTNTLAVELHQSAGNSSDISFDLELTGTTTTPPANQAPTIASLSDSPDPVVSGASVTLTGNSVADTDGTVGKVTFYRETNGVAGLQVGADTLVGTDTSSTGGWTAVVSTVGLLAGNYTYYARPTDNGNLDGNVVSTTHRVNSQPTIGSVTDGPDAVKPGSGLTLTANNVADVGGTMVSVAFYRESNGTAGLQVPGDTLVGTDTSATGGWSVVASTTGLATGTYLYYARATDSATVVSNVVSTGNRVSSSSVDVVLDNSDNTGVVITGTWTARTTGSGYFGGNYITDGNGGKGSRNVKYTPTLPSSGTYAVYGRWASSSSNATNARYIVTHSAGSTTVTANQQVNGGSWRLLGSFSFAAGTAGSVTISNTGTTQAVVADAVRFVRTGAAAQSFNTASLSSDRFLRASQGAASFRSVAADFFASSDDLVEMIA
jgi:hypothetical protein